MQPSVGRIVHYQSHGSPNGEHKSEAKAAVITAVNADGTVDLCVLNPTGMFFNRSVMGTAEGCEVQPGCWFWPPRI